uniref:Isoleucine--tRNA ligase, cytoplasmic n=1 Tax=Schistocephalus solidus TaxID=70667 RepID=A0A0X3PAM1_SCHSO
MEMDDLPASISFPAEEDTIIELFRKLNAFETSCEISKGRPSFTFYDGPPFATGLPHYGHLLAGTIKDIVTRYAYSQGFHVERHFGWDCHGLPVEYEVDKANNITGPHDVEAMGIAAYNNKCREIVMRYSEQWKYVVQRIGRWIDFKNDYRTMYPTFMESVWWAFKQLFEKGLVYRGVKVMPFSTACATPLSNFEAGQNYKDTQDPAIVVTFPLDNDPSTELLAWTTTPWTLPSNLALCVHPDKEYVRLLDKHLNRHFIMMECRIASLYKKDEDYEIVEKMKGSSLVGLTYKPLFDYFAGLKASRGAFRVVSDTYVTEDTGTGIVHQAPYFGEDDFRICLRMGIVTKEMPPVCPVDCSGKFTTEVTDFAGKYVKDADKLICQTLKKNGRLINQSTLNHSYPFCWRSDTPLLYKAVPTWFIRVEVLVERLLANNANTMWVPDFVKEKRFANWLRDARDWAVSRNRYWGTPIPLWASDDFEEIVCIGSIDELEALSGKRVTDLHKEYVDPITIPSKMGKGQLHRVSEVFDCWFESGSMPYAQLHYPFENLDRFKDGFPADFIAEGVDQTRGWFYTLLVLSTALFDKPPFKNLIVNGIVLASDGQKMSKRAKNYPDPMEVIAKHGADSLRLYLINSPVVRAQNLRFFESGVRDVVKDVFIPWYNAFRFLMKSSIQPYERTSHREFKVRPDDFPNTSNYMDQWILSFTQSLMLFVREELKGYRLYTVVPRLVKFIDHLVNWYIRMNRRRLKGDAAADMDDWFSALHTLVKVLYQLIILMAPFTPFFTEFIYQRLRQKLDFSEYLKKPNLKGIDKSTGAPESLHYIVGQQPHIDKIHTDIEETVAWMQACVELGRSIRTRKDLPLKAPLREAVVIHPDPKVHAQILSMQSYIVEELNVRNFSVTDDKAKYGVKLRGALNPVVGARLKSQVKVVAEAVKNLSIDELEEYVKKNEITVAGHLLSNDDLTVVYSVGAGEEPPPKQPRKQKPQQKKEQGTKKNAAPNPDTVATVNHPQPEPSGPIYEAMSDASGLLILLDVRPDEDLEQERLAREVINRIQRARKKANLVPEDPICVVISTASTNIHKVVQSHASLIDATVKQPIVCCDAGASAEAAAKNALQSASASIGRLAIEDEASIPPDELKLVIYHQMFSSRQPTATSHLSQSAGDPVERILTVTNRKSGEEIIVRLVNPSGHPLVTGVPDLIRVLRGAFGWNSSAGLRLFSAPGEELPVTCTVNVLEFANRKLFME